MAGCLMVGLRVDLHGVSMLQSVGSCHDSCHELSGVVCVAVWLSTCTWPMCIRGGGHDGCWHCNWLCCFAVALS